MNADKIYAEMIAKEYVPKLYYKTVALKKLDRKAKKTSRCLCLHIWGCYGAYA